MLVGLFVTLVALYPAQIFFCWNFHLGSFFGSTRYSWFSQDLLSFFLFFFLSFFLSFLSTPTAWVEGYRSVLFIS